MKRLLILCMLLTTLVEADLRRDQPQRGIQNRGQISRGPSMSRTQNRPQHQIQRPANRPQTLPNRGFDRSKLQQIQNRPPVDRGARQQQFRNNFHNNTINNNVSVNRLNSQLRRNRPDFNNWFKPVFFDHHHYNAFYYNNRQNWARNVGWNGVNSYLSWGWGEPYYYDDTGYPIAVSQDLYDNPQQPANYPSNNDMAQAAPDDSFQSDWLPLGVFASGRTPDQAAYSSMFVQLAVNKEGDLAGTYYNAATDQTHPLAGVVDKSTQLAVWEISDNPSSPSMTTGIYNLTQDVAMVNVTFLNGVKQTWFLVRTTP